MLKVILTLSKPFFFSFWVLPKISFFITFICEPLFIYLIGNGYFIQIINLLKKKKRTSYASLFLHLNTPPPFFPPTCVIFFIQKQKVIESIRPNLEEEKF